MIGWVGWEGFFVRVGTEWIAGIAGSSGLVSNPKIMNTRSINVNCGRGSWFRPGWEPFLSTSLNYIRLL
jgi:hypothetical protein